MHFSDAESMYTFSEKFDGHKFVDGKGMAGIFSFHVTVGPLFLAWQTFLSECTGLGHSVSCSVELSLSQRWTDPANRRDKKDATTNTIEQDENYVQFLEALKAPPVAPKEEPAPAKPNPNDLSKPMSTPILDELRKKAAMKQQQVRQTGPGRQARKFFSFRPQRVCSL